MKTNKIRAKYVIEVSVQFESQESSRLNGFAIEDLKKELSKALDFIKEYDGCSVKVRHMKKPYVISNTIEPSTGLR